MPGLPSDYTNDLGQPVGAPLGGWTGCAFPLAEPMAGRYCRLEPLDAGRHAADLWDAQQHDPDGRNWTYLPYGPFADQAAHRAWVEDSARMADPQFYAIIRTDTGQAVGAASYLRIVPEHGVIEVGHLNHTPLLQRTPASTEAMYLMMRRVFEEYGYRRYEWKCHAQNAPSWAAAERLGFTFEGVFRNAVVVKQRNRDTAWLSITDAEWPAIRAALEAWLAPENFEVSGQQREALSTFMARERGR
ncbi:MAG: GNAT family N-acetyltransferase [Dehalococcoidia bacterium]|nr:GNAT family N-acetyltransferase [Dehalococcoidia bacterium]